MTLRMLKENLSSGTGYPDHGVRRFETVRNAWSWREFEHASARRLRGDRRPLKRLNHLEFRLFSSQ
jgi:hypothetical protein